jgi:hypothetical protein
MNDLNLFCASCGTRLAPGSRFCSSCGWQIPTDENVLPSAGAPLPPAPDPTIPPYAPGPMQTPQPPPMVNEIPIVSQPGGSGQYARSTRRLSGGGLFLFGVLILLGSEIVRLATLHSDLLDMLGYVIILAFALPASLLAIRSRKTGKCAAGLILASVATLLILVDAWGLITNTLYVMQNPSDLITPEYQSKFLISKISYAIGHLISILAFLIMWISLFRKRSPA